MEEKKIEEEIKYKATFDEQGNVILKEKAKIKSGKRSKGAGARFELAVRKHWENQGWILDKWTNNIDLEQQQIIAAKRKFNPFRRVMTIGTGFPDFIAIKKIDEGRYDIIGIEVKMNGLLSKEEKQKCKVYLDKGIFSQLLIAKKADKRGEIEHVDFKERYGNI